MEKKSILFEEEKKNGEEWRTYLREGKNVADGRVGGNQCNGSIRGPRSRAPNRHFFPQKF